LGRYKCVYNTIDGLLIPIIVSTGCMSNYELIDRFVKNAMCSLINNYADCISLLKTEKKVFKKNFATGLPLMKGISQKFSTYF